MENLVIYYLLTLKIYLLQLTLIYNIKQFKLNVRRIGQIYME